MNIFQRWLKYLTTRSLHRDTIKQLNRLNDRELKDIGLSRGDIDRMVWLDEDMQQRGKSDEVPAYLSGKGKK